MALPQVIPAKLPEKPAVVNDSVRQDGGKPTEDQPVPPDQIKKIGRHSVDHTADEAGS